PEVGRIAVPGAVNLLLIIHSVIPLKRPDFPNRPLWSYPNILARPESRCLRFCAKTGWSARMVKYQQEPGKTRFCRDFAHAGEARSGSGGPYFLAAQAGGIR